MINGEFCERADSLVMSEYDVAYVTALPLKPTLLPYTVKICGAENVKNELATGLRLSPDCYVLSLSPRYMTMYGAPPKPLPPKTHIARLFALVKSDDLSAAYAMLTAELKSIIDKAALSSFFSNYEKIIDCAWEKSNNFYLVDANGIPKLHTYRLKNEFIDDISECE